MWSLYHNYSFDFSVWEIWGALLFGGALVIVDEDARRDPGLMLDLLEDNRISVLSQVPTPFKYLTLAFERDQRPLEALRYIVFGGEAIDKPSVRKWLSLRKGSEQLINMYGITETTVHVTAKVIASADVADDSSPSAIGRPLPHLEVALVSENGSVVSGCDPGEIWVCGSTVSPGYLRNPELTAQRFVTCDLGSGPRRWYRSGDLARLNSAGDLVYLGRIDSQISLRGFRVEFGEIEAVLSESAQVLNAAATIATLAGGVKGLFAVVVLVDSATEITGRELRELCQRRLPAHMVPDRVVIVDRIPTAPGGEKVDRRAIAAQALL